MADSEAEKEWGLAIQAAEKRALEADRAKQGYTDLGESGSLFASPTPMNIPPSKYAPLLGFDAAQQKSDDTKAGAAAFGGAPPKKADAPKAETTEYGEPLRRGEGGGVVVPVPPPSTPAPSGETGPKEEAPRARGDGNGGLPPISGGGGVLIPGGMAPYTEKTSVTAGKEVAPGVRDAEMMGMGLRMSAGQKEHEANVALYEQERQAATAKLMANDQAQLDHARVREERERITAEKMAKIETLNAAAIGKPEDVWNESVVFARVLGTILSVAGIVTTLTGGRGAAGAGISMGAGGAMIGALVNEDINSKKEARKMAGEGAKRETSLLGLHLDHLGDQDKAIEATKLGYYDSVLNQIEATRASHRGAVDDAKLDALKAQVIEMKGKAFNALHIQEQSDMQQESVRKMRAPQMFGGGGAGAGLQDVPNSITLSDGTSWGLDDSPTAQKARERIVAMQKLQGMNDEIKALRKEAYKLDPFANKTEYHAIISRLEDLGAQKAPLMSVALDGSVLRDAERAEMYKKNVKATEGLGYTAIPGSNKIPFYSAAEQAAADATIDSQQKLWQKSQKIEASGAGGRQIVRGYVHNETGEKRPVARYTGVDAKPTEHLPPDSFKPDEKREVPTRGKPLSESYGKAPDFGLQRTPPPSAHKKKKEK